LAQANPEARRSQTEIFSRDLEAPPIRKSSNNLVLVAVGAGALVVVVVLFFILRGPSGAARTAANAGQATPRQATAKSVVAAPTTGNPAVGVPAPSAVPAAEEPPPASAGVVPANSAGVPKKNKDAARSRRTSREAIDSLFPSEAGAPPSSATKGARTPNELKNPFAAPQP
ncbi:MAG: hypothetical protein H7X95_12645, partial [Deltaproteobacteria bacterium]|nr:hypothetical protein [Deltaproteobacteria bacterium]